MRWFIYLVDIGFTLYRWLIFARIILSWIPNVDYYHPLVKLLYDLTEPILQPFRRLVPSMGGIDFSPILVFLVLEFVRNAVVRLLFYI